MNIIETIEFDACKIRRLKQALNTNTNTNTKLQNYKITKLQNYKITKLQNYKITKLQNYKITKLQNYKITNTKLQIQILFMLLGSNFSLSWELSIRQKILTYCYSPLKDLFILSR